MFNLLKFIGIEHNVFMLSVSEARLKSNSPKRREEYEVKWGVEHLIRTVFPVEIATVDIISLTEPVMNWKAFCYFQLSK
jgi:hypothetical protein